MRFARTPPSCKSSSALAPRQRFSAYAGEDMRDTFRQNRALLIERARKLERFVPVRLNCPPEITLHCLRRG
jgi:hypothetical protein